MTLVVESDFKGNFAYVKRGLYQQSFRLVNPEPVDIALEITGKLFLYVVGNLTLADPYFLRNKFKSELAVLKMVVDKRHKFRGTIGV